MQAISMGLIQVNTPGTPVPISTDNTLRVMMMVVSTVPGFTGKAYLGLSGMNKNSSILSGVMRVFSEPAAFGPQDGEVMPPSTSGQGNPVRVADYWVDADVAGEGVLVTCYVE